MELENKKPRIKYVDKINYHFTNQCNYFCHHCYVNKNKLEIPLPQKLLVIDHIADYFNSIHIKGFINLVGGEPTLSPDFEPLLKYINSKGIDVGIVTNGTRLDDPFFHKFGTVLKEIGISIDSLNDEKNRMIGRCDSCGRNLSEDDWFAIIDRIKSSGIKLKINICLTQDNCDEDFTSFLKRAKPDRFKIMVLSIVSGINDDMVSKKPTPSQVQMFFERHSAFKPVLEKDGDMQNAYAMVNSRGFFYVNDQGYEKEICNLVERPLVFKDVESIDMKKYERRYSGSNE